jgi:hypothetical protein
MSGGKRATSKPTTAAPPISQFDRGARTAKLTPHAGKAAVKGQYRAAMVARAGHAFTNSVDIDSDFLIAEPSSVRWDYGLGLKTAAGDELAVWVEPHPASGSGEVQKMIDKLAWLRAKLAHTEFKELHRLTHMGTGSSTNPFRWLAITGAICIRPGSSEARRLALKGLSLPARHLVLP